MENYENELINELRSVNLILHEIWTEIGFDQETCVQRQTRIIELVKELLSKVLNGETSLKTKLATSIEENGKEFYHLNKELGTAIPDPDDGLTLLEVERYLRHNVEELHKEVKVRRDKLKELRDIEQELCERLVEEPSNVPKKPIPSKEDLEDLERRIRTLEQEKVNREKTFRHLKSNLSRLLDELELKANSSLELNVLSDVEDLFTLSRSNLHQMKQLNERYEQMVKENEMESLHLHDHIRLLYDRLEVDPSERDNFLDTVHGHTPSVLKKLQQEMHRLEELKHQNMARFINKLRRELEVLWDKCYISENERNAFTPYFAEGYTDELLKAHDKEVQKLQTYYSDNKLIFTKIKHRHEIWNKLVELEEKANDPNRLFGNRGCSLLQEEKERKRVKNELPRVEKELEDLVLAREKRDGQQFLVEGKTISDYIMDQWHQYHEQKEQEKRERQNARSKQLNSESRLGSKPPSVKRRIARNDTLRTSKLRRIGEEQSLGRSTPVTPSRGTRSVLREHDQNTLKNVSTNLFPKKDGTNLSGEVSSYSHFSDGIQRRSERENMRSSAVHGTKKTPLIHHPSPRHPPPGLPKTPKTLPRIAIRRSPRHSGSRSVRRSPKSATVSRLATPSSSSAFRSPHIGGSRRGTPNRWSKLSFLI